MRMCLRCEKEILEGEEFMVAVDRPYLHLWLHKECFKTLDFTELIVKIKEYIVRNSIKYRNMV
jgi:hypothetical protein